MLGLTVVMRSILTIIVVLASLTVWVIRHSRLAPCRRTMYRQLGVAHVLLFLFLLFCVHSAAYPLGDLRNSSAEVTQLLTGLPTDHLITYNTARFVVEGISPKIEVVPTWSVAERAPLAGLAVASLFHLLNLSERAHWLGSSPGIYYLFQSCMSFFNCLPLLSVFLLAGSYLGKREAILSLLLLGISPFFIINAIYPWPKMMMAFFFMTAISIWVEAENKGSDYILSGLLLAGAYLCHSIALFYILGFFLYIFLSSRWACLRNFLPRFLLPKFGRHSSCLDQRANAKTIMITAVSCFALLSPWLLFTWWLGASSRRLLYMHAFCILDYDVDAVPLLSAVWRYFTEAGFQGIVSARLSNAVYPFDPLPLIRDIHQHGLSLVYVLERLSHYSFYTLVFAYGPFGLPLILCGFFCAGKPSRLRLISAILLTAFPLMLIVFGCANYLTNHVWVYPLFVGLAIWMSSIFRTLFGALVLAVHLGVNITIIIWGFWFGKQTSAYLHSSSEYLIIQLAILCAIVVAAGFFLSRTLRRSETETVEAEHCEVAPHA